MVQANASELHRSRAHATLWKCHTNGGDDRAREEESTRKVPAAAERGVVLWVDTRPYGLCNLLRRHKE